jgi:hypothetical protein
MFATACNDTTGPEGLSTLTLGPTTQTVAVNETVQFTATGTRTTTPITTLKGETWSVAGGGTIDSLGLFTASPTPGTSTITVTCGGLTQSTTVTVTAGPLATITVTPNPATLAPGEQQQFTAVGKDAGDNVVEITPVWSTTTSSPGSINADSGLFTAGNTIGTFPNSVRAAQGAISGTATVTVKAGPLATITVTPNPATLAPGAQQQFTAVGKDARGNVVVVTPVWSTTSPPGRINVDSGLFAAGNTIGTFANSVRATQGAISGTATVIVTGLSVPVPPDSMLPDPTPPGSTLPPTTSAFAVLANVSLSCTDGDVIGSVGTLQPSPTGSITLTSCPLSGGTAQMGSGAVVQAYNNSAAAYTSLASIPCGTVLTGTLAGQTLAPGVYCFTAGATLTGTLTLNGPPGGVWLFKVGTGGVGALTATNLSVVMAGGAKACNVTWWVEDAATTTDSSFRGSIFAGGNLTMTRGNTTGNGWSRGDVTITGTAVTGCS